MEAVVQNSDMDDDSGEDAGALETLEPEDSSAPRKRGRKTTEAGTGCMKVTEMQALDNLLNGWGPLRVDSVLAHMASFEATSGTVRLQKPSPTAGRVSKHLRVGFYLWPGVTGSSMHPDKKV